MKRKNRLIIFVITVFLLSLFTFNSFAAVDDSYFTIPYDTGTIYDPSDVGSISDFDFYSYNEYDTDYFDDRSFSWLRKPIGAFGISYNAGTGFIPEDPQYILGDVIIQYPYTYVDSQGKAPRVVISPGKSSFWLSNQTTSPFGFVGWSFRCSEVRSGVVNIKTWRTYSFTLDYPSNESYDIDIRSGQLSQVEYDGNHLVELRFRYVYDSDNQLLSLYMSTFKGYILLDEMFCLDPLDFTSIRIGMYDAVEPPSTNSIGSQVFLKSWIVQGGGQLAFQAYNDGYSFGFSNGLTIGRNEGFSEGFQQGYEDGLLDGSPSEISVPGLISSYVNSGVTLFRNIFGFEIFGINFAGLIGGLTAVVVLSWLIRKLVR